jgi:hypothetical protein
MSDDIRETWTADCHGDRYCCCCYRDQHHQVHERLDGVLQALAAANATIAAQALALATMREACIEEVKYDDGTFMQQYQRCQLCWFSEHEDGARHHADCILAQPADTAAALAGAVLAAAEDCHGLLLMLADDLVRNGRSGESLTEVHAAIVRFDRARSALRGHGAVEG